MSTLASPALQAAAFARTLYSRAEKGWWEFRPTSTKGAPQSWFPLYALPRFDWLLNRWAGYHAFFGVHPRREQHQGGRDGVDSLVAVFADVDCHKQPDQGAAFKQTFRVFPHPPSLVVKTGSPNSFHLYWVLQDPLIVSPETEHAYRRVMLGLGQHFGGDMVADLPRVMRLPGSVNLKPGNGGSMAQLAACNRNRLYTLADFELWAVETPARKDSRTVAAPDNDDLPAEFVRRGWLLSDQGGAKFYVQCPWEEQHSGEINKSSTALWKTDGRWLFKCFHEHCKTRWRQEVLEYFRLVRLHDTLGAAGVR